MTTFAAPASTLEAKAPDASKHVNYTLGMVLGVDDFNQEFAWLSGRDRWLARDAAGYGTLNGLAVSLETPTPAKGPRVNVTSGSALTPRGQLVCVKPAQCAYLNDWLAAHKADIPPLLGSPISGTIALYLTLCYRDCPDDLVPIPGTPCRTEDQLQAPSRLVDGFSLDFRTSPPDQNEEDLLREYVNWLRTLAFSSGGPYVTVAAFEQTLRGVAKSMAAVTSPPSTIHFPVGSPLASLRLDPAHANEYYQVAFRVWIEAIRPLVHPLCADGCACGCGGTTETTPKADECLLLARVNVPVQLSSGNWIVSNPANITIDESRRPMLLHLRMLQELFTSGALVPAQAARSRVVAAGSVSGATQEAPVFGLLTVAVQAANTLRVGFAEYQKPLAGSHMYSVTAMARSGPIGNPTIQFDSYANNGILLKVTNGAAAVTDANLKATMFNIEVRRVE
jgi:hypothetical protein